MKFSLTHSFAHPIDVVWAMFHNPDSHVAKFARMGHTDIEVVESKVTATSLDLTLQRKVEMDVPSIAKKFLSPVNTVTSTDHWADRGDGTYGGRFTVDIKGVPAESAGTTDLRPTGDQCCDYTVSLELKVKVPLVGEKIAGALKGQLQAQVEQEFDATEAWLTETAGKKRKK